HLHSVLSRADTALAAAQRRLRRTLGRVEAVRILPFRSWVTPQRCVVLGRAVLADVALQSQLEHLPRLVRVVHEKFWTLESPPVAVRVSWEGRTSTVMSDSGGFIDAGFPLDGAPPVTTTRARLILA